MTIMVAMRTENGSRKWIRVEGCRCWAVDSIGEFISGYDVGRSGETFHIRRLHVTSYSRLRPGCFVINRIEIPDRWQRRGYGTQFLSEVEEEAAMRGWFVYVECVFNPFLREHLRKRGYMRLTLSDWAKGSGAETLTSKEPPFSREEADEFDRQGDAAFHEANAMIAGLGCA